MNLKRQSYSIILFLSIGILFFSCSMNDNSANHESRIRELERKVDQLESSINSGNDDQGNGLNKKKRLKAV